MLAKIGIIIALIILAIMIYVFYKGELYPYMVIDVNSKLSKVSLSKTKFRSGDLIMFRYDYFKEPKFDKMGYYEMIISCLPCKLPFTHIGMVAVINDIPYITHIANYSIYDGSGQCVGFKSDLFNLYDYLDNYEGNIYHCRYIGKELDDYHLYRKMEMYEKLDFKLDHITLLDSLIGTDIADRKNKTLTCSSYVVKLLMDSDILGEDSYNSNHFSPNNAFIEAYGTGNYAEPVILINKYALGYSSNRSCKK
jgi:hypothetical protein